eukprot:TRINITY_DN31119_c0_g1_i2.p1 TRINITY_DN31119_c0_g1~~TRINITY_DN31119_c0_g1_i2.p1  ORF type:complete len:1036 (+),score=194.03 TRINITY_DN31119_c0_g1_i2:104-3211(+)
MVRSCLSSFLQSHSAGPLCYDTFRKVGSLQLHATYDKKERKRLQVLTHREERMASRLRLCMDPLVGVGAGLTAFILRMLTTGIWDIRQWGIQAVIGPGPLETWGATAAAVGGTVVFSFCAWALVAWRPPAASSGIPQVIAFLNGVDVSKALEGQVLVAKLLGTALACGAGLAVGPEGPMIHMGSIIGMLTIRRCLRPLLRHCGEGGRRLETELAMQPLKYDIMAIAMGGGAGVAAAFQAPLAGTMLVAEEAASYFSKRLFIHTFVTCAFAVFTAMLCDYVAGFPPETMYARVRCPERVDWWGSMLIVQCLTVGLICGVAASLFNHIVVSLNKMRTLQAQKWSNDVKKLRRVRLCEVMGVAVVSSALSVLLPGALQCQDASIQTAFADGSGCLTEEWLSQLVMGARRVHRSSERDGHINWTPLEELHYIPVPGLFGAQYDPTLCPEAIKIEPRCRLMGIEAHLPKGSGWSPEHYCCGFLNYDALKSGHFFNWTKPAFPLRLDAGWQSSMCPEPRYDSDNQVPLKQFSPAASVSLVQQRNAVRNVLMRGAPGMLPASTLGLYLAVYFLLAALSAGMWVPGGLVVPMMLIGALIGRLCGVAWLSLLKNTSLDKPTVPWVPELMPLLHYLHGREYYNLTEPGVLAVVGAASFMSGSGSLVLFVIVLIMEITLDPEIIPAMIVGVMTARATAFFLGSKGLYHELIEVGSLPYMSEHEHWRQRQWLVADVLDADEHLARVNMEDVPVHTVHSSGSDARPGEAVSVQLSQVGTSEGGSLHIGSMHITEGMATQPSATAPIVMTTVEDAGNMESRGPGASLAPRIRDHGSSHVLTVSVYASAEEVRELLSRCLPGDDRPMVNGFPVVRRSGQLCGLVTRDALEQLLEERGAGATERPRAPVETAAGQSSAAAAAASAQSRSAAMRQELLTEGSVSSADSFTEGSPTSESRLGVGDVMDASPFIVQASTPVHHAFMLFRQLGLRHLVAVDDHYRPLGVMTRKSLMPWRTPWDDEDHRDTFVEVRARHSPPPSPDMAVNRRRLVS